MENIERIIECLSRIRIKSVPEETDIHGLICDALNDAGIEFHHEKRLNSGLRPDFMIGNIALEVKKSKPNATALKKQLSAYLESDEISAVVLVSQKRVNVPVSINGKRIYPVFLDRLWGVSLP